MECLLDILHIGTTTGKDDTAQQLFSILFGYLAPYVGHNLLQTSLDNLDELASLYLTLVIDGVFQVVVDLIVFRIGRTVLQLHALGIALFHLQRGNILGDVVGTKRDDSQMTKDVLGVDADGRGVCTQVDQHTARAAFRLGEHAVGQCQRGKIHLGNGDVGSLETAVQILVECLALQDVKEITLNASAGNAHGLQLVL